MTPRSSPIDLSVLGRYLDGTATPADAAAVETWIGTDAGRRAAVAALQAAWVGDRERLEGPYDVDAAWARFAAWRGRGVTWPVPRARSLASRWRVGVAAAIVAVAIGAGGAWWIAGPLRRVAQTQALREYTTPRGRRAVFRLLDGTEITLNADSRLRVPVPFAGRERDVYLDGEAFFSVVHDTAHPLVVHTAGGAIRDIGTAFGVRAYGDAGSERVAVVEGAVAVAGTSLRAGQVATRLRTGAVHVVRGASVSDEVAWTHGRLVFANVPLGEAAQALSRWYDLDVRVADPELARRPVTGSYRDEPVTQVLTLITAAVGARYEWEGRSVTIATLQMAR